MEQMNGLDIAGKPIKVSTVTDTSATTAGSLELEEFDRLAGGAWHLTVDVGSAKANGREPKTGLARVFNYKYTDAYPYL